MQTIEFSDRNLSDANPLYTFEDNTVTFLGEVFLDTDTAGDRVLKGYTAPDTGEYTPITAAFGLPARDVSVSMDAGTGGTIIVGYDASGNIIMAEQVAELQTEATVSFNAEMTGLSRVEIYEDPMTLAENMAPENLLDGALDLVTGLVSGLVGGVLGGGGSPFVEVELNSVLSIVETDAQVTVTYPAVPGAGTGVPAFDSISIDRSFASYEEGTASADTVIGTEGEDLIEAQGGNDFVIAGDGDDIIFGGSGKDILVGGEGADVLNGGAGHDWAFYTSSNAAVTVDLGIDTAFGGDAEGDTLTNIERILGSRHDDTITGDDSANHLNGHLGDDVLNGGAGNDFLRGGAGADVLNGGAGNDVLNGDDGADVLNGGAGDDILRGGEGADALNGGTGNDWAYYNSSNAAVTVDLGNNTATGGDATGDTFTGIERVLGSHHDDTITGDGAANYLSGHFGDDVLNGGTGNDILFGGEGADALNGGTGTDWAYYTSSNAAISVDLSSNTGTGGEAAGDTFTSVERVLGSLHDDTITGDGVANHLSGHFGDDALNGRAGNDVLRGGAGTDALNGDGGNDILVGGEGADALNGGAGLDWAHYISSDAAVTVDLGSNTASGGEATGDTFTSVERVLGSRHDDTITGDDADNYLNGHLGDDALNGGAGNDIMIGGQGADAFHGGTGDDWAYYFSSKAAITVDLSNNTASGGDAAGDTFTSVERILGSRHDDTITGDGAVNYLNGNVGNDALNGGAGNDFLRGGSGADALNGGTGNDWAYYTSSHTAVTIDLGNNTASGGEAAGDTFTSVERILGSLHDDTITGDGADNHLNGHFGDDTLSGGAGNDVLRGGHGADTFVFNDNDGADRIADFEDGVDLLAIAGSTFDALSITDTIGGTSIDYGTGTIELSGVDTTMLSADDFIFV